MLKNKFKNSILKTFFEVFSKLSKNDKKTIILVLISCVISSFAEFSSLGLVIPSIKLIFNDNLNQVKINFLNYSFPENYRLILLSIFSLIFIFIALLKVCCIRFSINSLSKVGSNLFINGLQTILKMDLKIHKSKNSSYWITILNEGSTATQFALFQFSILISSFILFLFSLFLIISIKPKITFSIIFIGSILYLISYKFSKDRLHINDNLIKNGLEQRLLKLRESIVNIRQILLYGQSSYFSKKIHLTDYKLRQAQASNLIIGSTPRSIIESLAIVSLLILSYLLSNTTNDKVILFSEIGLIAIATSKILQGLNSVFLCWAAITGRKKIIKEFIELINLENYKIERDRKVLIPLKWNELILKNVSFSYPGNQKKILDKVNLIIKNGDSIGIIGKTGSGKSTLTDIVMGLIMPTEGEVLLDGVDLYKSQKTLKKWRSNIGHVPQEQVFSDDKLINNLIASNPIKKIDKDFLLKIKDYASIDFGGNNIKEISQKEIGENGCLLSGGQRQRISIAKALYRNPSILILDEATSSLDQFTEKKILKSIYKYIKNITIISISHDLTNLKHTNRIFKVRNANIIEIKNNKF